MSEKTNKVYYEGVELFKSYIQSLGKEKAIKCMEILLIHQSLKAVYLLVGMYGTKLLDILKEENEIGRIVCAFMMGITSHLTNKEVKKDELEGES